MMPSSCHLSVGMLQPTTFKTCTSLKLKIILYPPLSRGFILVFKILNDFLHRDFINHSEIQTGFS